MQTERTKRGRPPLTQLDVIKTKAWAYYCSDIYPGKRVKRSPYELAKQTKNLSPPIDNARFGRWLKGQRGISSITVKKLEKIFLGASQIFKIGPFIDRVSTLHTNIETKGAYIPLWDCLKGDIAEMTKGWQKIPRTAWFTWTPWVLLNDFRCNIRYIKFRPKTKYITEYNLLPPKQIEIQDPKTGEIIGYENEEGITFEPCKETYLRDDVAIREFLSIFIQEGPFTLTSKLLALTAAISVARYRNKKMLILEPWMTKKLIEPDLNDIGTSFSEIAAICGHHGLQLYEFWEYWDDVFICTDPDDSYDYPPEKYYKYKKLYSEPLDAAF